MSKLTETVNFRETSPVTANKVRFQHMNTLKLFTLWLIVVAKRNKLITSYYEVEGIRKCKTTKEIQLDKERHLHEGRKN